MDCTCLLPFVYSGKSHVLLREAIFVVLFAKPLKIRHLLYNHRRRTWLSGIANNTTKLGALMETIIENLYNRKKGVELESLFYSSIRKKFPELLLTVS